MPKPLNSRSQELVASLISYFEKERDNGGPFFSLNCIRERVAAALNIGINTVSRVSQKVKSDVPLKSPKKKRPYKKRITNQDHLDVGSIRNQIYEMYKKKETVYLVNIYNKLKNMQLFEGCKSLLRTLLRDIGFKWSKDNRRRGLMELPAIAFKRIQFLKAYQQIKEESLYDFIYLDETWIFQNGTLAHSWQDDNKKSVKATKVDGKRYIVLHAGNKNGFIPGAELVFSSKSKGDYHGEMNQNNFLVWFENQLLKNLEEPSVIIMDNASYHSTLVDKTPTSGSTKAVIKEWLTKHNLNFKNTMLKTELL